MKRRQATRVRIVASTAAAFLAVSAGALAYWSAQGAGGGTAAVGTLRAPKSVAATVPDPGGRAIRVGWTGITDPDGGRLQGAGNGYYVQRFAGPTPSPACGSSPAAPLPGTTTACEDILPGAGTYTYKVTAVFRSWSATSSASAGVTVNQVLTSLHINPASATIAPGGAQDYTATGSDQFGASLGDVTDTTTFTISPDGSCRDATCSALIPDTAGSHHTVTGTNSGATASADLTVSIVPAGRLVFTAGPTAGAAAATATLGPITVEVQDSAGKPVPAGRSGITVALSSDSSGTAVFASELHGTPVTTVIIPAGSASATFYYGDTKAGSSTITASSSGVGPATQTETVTAGAASALAFTEPDHPLECSVIATDYACTVAPALEAGGAVTASVSFVDAFGNVAVWSTSADATVTLSAPGTGTVNVTSLTILHGSTTSTASFTLAKSGSEPVSTTATFGELSVVLTSDPN